MKKTLLTVLIFLFLTASAFAGALININTADQATLESIPHIGPAKAAAIMAYRKVHPFESIEDLANVKGIGAATVEKIKELLCVSD